MTHEQMYARSGTLTMCGFATLPALMVFGYRFDSLMMAVVMIPLLVVALILFYRADRLGHVRAEAAKLPDEQQAGSTTRKLLDPFEGRMFLEL